LPRPVYPNGATTRNRPIETIGTQRGRVVGVVPGMTPLLVALSFLTLYPAGWGKSPNQIQFSASRAYYPVVGLLIGLVLLGLEWGASQVVPTPLTAALLLVALIVITRGLHLDGLMDTCDGVFGGYTRERRLEIMRDSHVGAFAVVGASGLLILKYGALLSLLTLPAAGKQWALLLFPMLSRWSMVIQIGGFPYVRSQGLGSLLHQGNSQHWLATSVALVLAAVIAVVAGGIGGIAMLAAVSVLAWLLGWAMARMLGGLTGDTYGATNEITEAASLVMAVVLLPYGLIQPLPQLLGLW